MASCSEPGSAFVQQFHCMGLQWCCQRFTYYMQDFHSAMMVYQLSSILCGLGLPYMLLLAQLGCWVATAGY